MLCILATEAKVTSARLSENPVRQALGIAAACSTWRVRTTSHGGSRSPSPLLRRPFTIPSTSGRSGARLPL